MCAGLALVGASCGGDPADDDSRTADVEVWYHAGQPGERAVLEAQAARFNARQDSIRVQLSFLPEGSYNAQVQASAVAGKLPDLLDLDGPYVATYAWQGHLGPLDGLLADSVVDDLLPSIRTQGTWNGTLYGIGTFDSGLALYGDRRALRAVDARVPDRPLNAWSTVELSELLGRLAAADDDGAVLDLKLNYEGEWFTYAFQPTLRSAGGGLLDMSGGVPVAEGTLNGLASVEAMRTLQSWMTAGWVDPNLDDAAFVSGRVALSWSGHWDYPRYRDALGDDLLVLPLPDFGLGTRTGQGSWVWTIPRGSAHPEAAAAFLSFLLEPEQVLEMADANGAVPGTRTAARSSEAYGPDGPLHLILRQLEEGWSVPRPQTPAYPFTSSLFQDVFDAVRNGEAVPAVLDRAAEAIDQEISDNHGFRLP
ncbi:MAG: extracellular solute-binding protein [Gemmatimonadota bacterium]